MEGTSHCAASQINCYNEHSALEAAVSVVEGHSIRKAFQQKTFFRHRHHRLERFFVEAFFSTESGVDSFHSAPLIQLVLRFWVVLFVSTKNPWKIEIFFIYNFLFHLLVNYLKITAHERHRVAIGTVKWIRLWQGRAVFVPRPPINL